VTGPVGEGAFVGTSKTTFSVSFAPRATMFALALVMLIVAALVMVKVNGALLDGLKLASPE
jgi:hypothetical protein